MIRDEIRTRVIDMVPTTDDETVPLLTVDRYDPQVDITVDMTRRMAPMSRFEWWWDGDTLGPMMIEPMMMAPITEFGGVVWAGGDIGASLTLALIDLREGAGILRKRAWGEVTP